MTKAYPIGQQIFYSDLKLADNPDSILIKKLPRYEFSGNIINQYNTPKFKSILFEQQSIIKKGDLFNEKMYYQTLNNFSSLGAWQQIDGRTTLKNDSVYLHYFLVPALRHSFSFDVEGSKNNSQLIAGDLLGLSTSFTYRDKNVQRKSIPSITNLRSGIELNVNNGNGNLTQTLLFNIGHTYSFPNLIIPFVSKKVNDPNATRTNFSLNGAYIDRLSYYQLKSITASWGYETKKNKNGSDNTWIYRPLNIELYHELLLWDLLLLLMP